MDLGQTDRVGPSLPVWGIRPEVSLARQLACAWTAITWQAYFTHGSLQPDHAPEAQPHHGDRNDAGQNHENPADSHERISSRSRGDGARGCPAGAQLRYLPAARRPPRPASMVQRRRQVWPGSG